MTSTVSGKTPRARKRFGPFEIIERLGSGGMAVVYKARHPGFPKPVALKIANMLVVEDIDLSQRFEGEFDLGRQLSHPNLVKTLAYGINEKIPYLVMEYVPGCDLDKFIQQNGALSEAKAVEIFSQLVEAVQFIHERKLVHRDIKPANVLIDPSGEVKLADLGLIKNADAQNPQTRSRVTLGTPDYLAPEQHENAANADFRCDIFSLGVTLYVALTGVFPFGRGGLMATLLNKIKFEFAPLSRVLNEIGEAIDQAVTRAMHPDPRMRQSTAREFLTEITGKTTLSRPQLTPTCPEPYRLESKSRRKHSRTPMSISGINVSLEHSEMPACEGETANISTRGICIMMRRAFSVGSILKLTFPTTADNKPLRARVCWVRQTLNRQWLVGCAFSSELKSDQLKRLTDAQAETEVIHSFTKT
jgi:serine/threonine protein kinase